MKRVLPKELLVVAVGFLGKYFDGSEKNQFKSTKEAKGLFQKYGLPEHKILAEKYSHRLVDQLI